MRYCWIVSIRKNKNKKNGDLFSHLISMIFHPLQMVFMPFNFLLGLSSLNSIECVLSVLQENILLATKSKQFLFCSFSISCVRNSTTICICIYFEKGDFSIHSQWNRFATKKHCQNTVAVCWKGKHFYYFIFCFWIRK